MVNNENQLNSYDVNPVHQMAQGNHDHAEQNQDESEDQANDDVVSEDNNNNANDTFNQNNNTSDNQYNNSGDNHNYQSGVSQTSKLNKISGNNQLQQLDQESNSYNDEFDFKQASNRSAKQEHTQMIPNPTVDSDNNINNLQPSKDEYDEEEH